MILTYDICRDNRSNLQSVEHPTWSDIESTVRQMDAEVYTEVSLKGDSYLSIGGGNGRYFVSVFTDDERCFVLTDDNNPDNSHVTITSGCQSISLPQQKIVDVNKALRAAMYFHRHSDVDPELTWIEE